MKKILLKLAYVSIIFCCGLFINNIPVKAVTQSATTSDGYTISAYNYSAKFTNQKSYEWSTTTSRIVNRISITYTIKNNATGATIYPSLTRNGYNKKSISDYMSPTTSNFTSVTTANFSSHSSVYTTGHVIYLSSVA